MLAALSGQSSMATPTRAKNRRAQYRGQAFVVMDVPNWAPNVNVVLALRGNGYISAQVPDGTYLGGNQRGAGSVDFQTTRYSGFQTEVCSGQWSLMGGQYCSNTADHCITWGNQSSGGANDGICVGYQCQTSGTASACALGYSAISSGVGSMAFGYLVAASGDGSLAGGVSSTASARGSMTSGEQALANKAGQRAIAAGSFAAQGDAQGSTIIARVATSGATATNVWLDGSSLRVTIPANTYWKANVHVVAMTAVSGASYASFERKVSIWRGVLASTTTLPTGGAQTIGTDDGSNAGLPPTGWAVAITADTTNGALDIKVTGAAATNIRWVVKVEFTEVSFP